jgi:hypothetical protein
MFWAHIDVFSMDHYTKDGESATKRRTPLGFSFTIAFLPVAIMVIIGLSVSNRPIETPSLQAASPLNQSTNTRMEASTGHLSVHLTLPLGLEPQHDGANTWCQKEHVTMTPDAAGCNATVAFVPPATCAVTSNKCTFGLDTVFKFPIPWNQRWVEWKVTTETASVGQGKTISGQVVCAAPDRLISGTIDDPIAINIQAMASYRNDTTAIASGATTAGYDLYPLPHAAPTTRPANEATLANGAKMTDDWTLKITLRRSPLVHMVNISRPLSPFQLLALCLSTVLSFLGIWRGFFKLTENYVSWQATNLQNKRQARNDARGVADNGSSDGARSGNDTTETKNDDGGLEMQAAVRIRTASTELFDDQQLPSTTNSAYGHHRASIGDYAQRTARLEKHADDAKTRADVAEKRADLAEKQAHEAERLNEKRFLEMEQRLERAVNKKEGGGLAL